jgi:hypothetical protein
MKAALRLMAACMADVPVARRRCIGTEGAERESQN